jgi:predicted aspartyl protease
LVVDYDFFIKGVIMGRIFQTAQLTNIFDMRSAVSGTLPKENVRHVAVNFFVDTGAAMVCLPTSTIEKLGLMQEDTIDVRTGNGIVQRNVFEPVRITIPKFQRSTYLPVMEIPSSIDAPPLLGYIALEMLDLHINPKEHTLMANPATDGKWIMDLL